jgi:serine/threonine protein kinase/regulation of enolase protein 1 (concanavalin A-like superfamily)
MNEESIFAAALEKHSAAERQAYLDQACGGDPALREQVEGLLAASDDAGSFLGHAAIGTDATIAPTIHSGEASGQWTAALPFLEPLDKPDRLGKLGHYEIIEVVGHGGMGAVLRAFDTKLSRVVAVKVMAPELAANPMAVKRFQREASAAAQVHHDHVVTIHAVDESHRPPYLVMQFIDGQTLQQKIDREGALPLMQILRIGSQMALGLAAAHKLGLIHRDVKPANVLLENGVERVKITDFGLARAADDMEMTQAGMIAGTPQYMSPEQAKGDPIDTRSDLFSLGSVLYTMCSGRPAFRAETTMGVLHRVCADVPRPIREVNAEIPAWLEAIVNKLLAKQPGERFQTAGEVAELLGQHLAHLQNPSQVARPATVVIPPEPKPTPMDRRPSWKLPALLMLVAAVVLSLPLILGGMIIAGWIYHRSAGRNANGVILSEIQPSVLEGPWQTYAELAAKSNSVDGWVPLFNGVTLADWRAVPPQNWHVEEGVIHGRGANAFLLSEVGDFEDFHLRMEFRINESGDAGVLFRMPPPIARRAADRRGYTLVGLEAEIGIRKDDGFRTGALTDKQAGILVESSIPPHAANEWIRLEVIAVQDQVQILVNGKLVTDYRDTKRRFRRGHIALTSWEDGKMHTHVEFRKVEIKQLPDVAPGSSAAAVAPLAVDPATWGRFDDPTGDCTLVREPQRVTMKLPADKYLNLSTGPGGNLDAPRLVQEVTGDFLFQATVRPFDKALSDTHVGDKPPSWKSAGLLVSSGQETFLRVELASWGESSGGAYQVNAEWHDGQRIGAKKGTLPPNHDAPTHLQVERRGQVLYLRGSWDGKKWFTQATVADLPLPQRVAVGLLAVKTTKDEFAATFENAALWQTTESSQAAGWSQLFNGQDLTGWKAHPDRPSQWQVAGGILTGTEEQSYLFSERGDYENFHLRVEALVNDGGDSGIYFRAPFELAWQGTSSRHRAPAGGYEAELHKNPAHPEKTGSVFGLETVQNDELIRPGEWFTLEVIAEGNRFITKIDGREIANCIDPQNKFQRGHLALQSYLTGTIIQFRKIEIKELPPSRPEDIWSQLFNRRDLTGWKTHPDQPGTWEVQDGMLIGSTRQSYLFSERGDYRDFHVRAECKVNGQGDSGIFFRVPFSLRKGPQAWMIQPAGGYEAELYNDPELAGSLWEIVANQRPGLLGRATGDRLARADEWFTLEIIAQGNHIITKVNGRETVSCSDTQGKYAAGHLALAVAFPQTVVQFRKIEIRELPPSPPN